MDIWVIVLFIELMNGTVHKVQLKDVTFNNVIECNTATKSEEFRDYLQFKYSGTGVAYIKPICKPVNWKAI